MVHKTEWKHYIYSMETNKNDTNTSFQCVFVSFQIHSITQFTQYLHSVLRMLFIKFIYSRYTIIIIWCLLKSEIIVVK